MSAIFKREYRSYFTSPLGFVFCAVYLLFMNLYFYLFNIQSASADLSYIFSQMISIMMMVIPLLTMRLFSEEFKQKNDQLLLTAPVRLSDIVMGKFLAAMGVYLTALAFTLLYSVVVAVHLPASSTMNPWVIVGNYIAIIAVASVFISVGLFISSLTESQLVAAVATYGIFIILSLLEAVSASVTSQFFATVTSWISIYSRYDSFTRGVFSLSDFFYYISVSAVFLFLTIRVLERKRWA